MIVGAAPSSLPPTGQRVDGEGAPPFARGRSRWPRLLRSPLRARIYGLVVTASALAILAVWVAGGGNDLATHDLAALQFQTTTVAGASSLAARVDAILASLALADATIQPGDGIDQICNVLAQRPQRPYQRVYVFLSTGMPQCSSVPETPDRAEAMRQSDYFQGALTTGRDQVGGPLTGPFTGRLSLAFAHPIHATSSPPGVVVAEMDVVEMLRPDLLGVHAERLILTGRGGERYEAGAASAPELPSEVVSAVDRARSTGSPCPVLNASTFAWSCSPVGETGLVLLAGQPAADVFAISSGAAAYERYRAIGIIVVAVFAAAAIDFLFVRRVGLAYVAAGLPPMRVVEVADRDEVDALREWAGTTSATIDRLQATVDAQAGIRMESERELLTLFAEAVELKSPFLRGHGDRVERYARQIGTRLGLHDEDLELLAFAARVHDIGRVGIPDAIHLKPGALEPIEMAQIQLHTTRGEEMARRMRTVPSEVARAVLHHHERWDGGGYPEGLAGVDIPLWSRIISVADAYDAMTEERPYRPRALSHAEAVRTILDGAGIQWDSTVVHAFLEVIEGGDIASAHPPIPFPRAASDG